VGAELRGASSDEDASASFVLDDRHCDCRGSSVGELVFPPFEVSEPLLEGGAIDIDGRPSGVADTPIAGWSAPS